MNITTSDLEWAVGFFDYAAEPPAPELFIDFIESTKGVLERCGLKPNWMGVSGRPKYFKTGYAVHKRIVESRYEGVTSIDLVVNPPDSDAPAYDRVFSSGLSWYDFNTEMKVTILINNAIIPFRSTQFWDMMAEMTSLREWAFGFGLIDKVGRHPDLHVLGAGDGNLTPEEQVALNRWYGARPETRKIKIRDVYPVNFLNKHQLSQMVSENETLRQFISRANGTRTKQVGSLLLWEVPDDQVMKLRKELQGSNAIAS